MSRLALASNDFYCYLGCATDFLTAPNLNKHMASTKHFPIENLPCLMSGCEETFATEALQEAAAAKKHESVGPRASSVVHLRS